MSVLDVILWANTKAALLNWGKTTPTSAPLLNAAGNPVEGVDYCWWRDDGKFLTGPGTTLAGFVMLARLHTTYFNADKLADSGEQWAKSTVAKYIKDNGTPGSLQSGAINYYELSGVRLFRPADVEAWLTANNLPGHMWVGGNSY